ncbi:unnamed protein product [Cylicocyclus nassatus]|uniref:HMG box domain-containing protein n=1 Tax=Cylicocyclus nassatus TaxID=53992 RepID=A0AA36M0E2_CYLNA|nr:unnamed protein product [Cylicocyclus nassatus]
MEDFSMYNIPFASIDWHSIQPTFFDENNPSNKQLPSEVQTSMNSLEDSNQENTRPVSAYAMFFRERQMIVKKSFPDATFGNISKIVAAEWDSLEKHEKEAYKRRTEQLRKKHIKLAVEERLQRICRNHTKTGDSSLAKELRQKRSAIALKGRPLSLKNSNL